MQNKKCYILQKHIIWYILPLWVTLTTKIRICETDAKSLWNNQCGQMIHHRKLYIQVFGNMIEGTFGKSGKSNAAGARVLQLPLSLFTMDISFLSVVSIRNVNGCTGNISIFHMDFFGNTKKQVKMSSSVDLFPSDKKKKKKFFWRRFFSMWLKQAECVWVLSSALGRSQSTKSPL